MENSKFRNLLNDIKNPRTDLKFFNDSIKNILTLGLVIGFAINTLPNIEKDHIKVAVHITLATTFALTIANIIQLLSGFLDLFNASIAHNRKLLKLAYFIFALILTIAITLAAITMFSIGLGDGIRKISEK